MSLRLVKPLLRYSDLTVIKMATVCHLGFVLQEFRFLTANAVHRVNMRHCAKFRADRSNDKQLWTYDRFSIFHDGGRPPCWICYTPVWTTDEGYSVVFLTVQIWIESVQ